MAAALASQALAFLASHALAATAVTGAALLLLQLARHAFADADFGALAALRAYPRRGAFAGQVVLIVGASSGIGEALALEFARGGATVLLAARRMELLLALAERCLAEGAPASEAVKLDVTALEAHEATLDYLLRKYKRIDVLCNNAGRSQRGLVEATPAAVDLELFQLNFFSVVAFTKALLRRALAAGAALRVLNTSSVAGKLGSPLSASYAASKHALQGWMDTLRMEMGWRGVSYSCVRQRSHARHTSHSTHPTLRGRSLSPTPAPAPWTLRSRCTPLQTRRARPWACARTAASAWARRAARCSWRQPATRACPRCGWRRSPFCFLSTCSSTAGGCTFRSRPRWAGSACRAGTRASRATAA